MTGKTFKQLEQAGWRDKAAAYDDIFALITRQAIAPMLDGIGELGGKRLLDVACGTGHLAAEAARRGAWAEGTDFADEMLCKAAVNYPEIPFHYGDAENLFYEDGSFDAVACNFGVLHFEDAEAAFAEACRVLRAGGRYAFTAWCGPDQGCDFMRLVWSAVQAHGDPDVDLPPAPPMFRFADADVCERAVSAAGFADPEITRLELTWSANHPDEIIELIYKSVVRAPMVLQAQTPRARDRIHAAIIDGAEALRADGVIRMAFPAVMTIATRR
jgi:SAM-dependent methyltransferase